MTGKRGLSRLRRAVQKIRLLLAIDSVVWQLSSLFHRATRSPLPRSLPPSPSLRQLSMSDQSGLLVCTMAVTEGEDDKSVRRLERVKSYSTDEDIDKRSETFISNFYRQLQLERQISLELSYNRGNSSSFNSRCAFFPSPSS